MDKKELGIYIHIPFCKQKCYYCDFISYSNQCNEIPQYIESLLKEIEEFDFTNYKVTTIYLGGGTPSYIDSNYIKQILAKIKEKAKYEIAEITIEVNPGTVTEKKLMDYREAGMNRISIGLQATQNRLLEQIGRIHTYQEFLDTYHLAKKVGFENVNVDLMLGLPNQTIKDLKESLEKIVKLNPNHVSVYSLIVEEGTAIAKWIEEGKMELPEEEQERRMYWYVKNFLELNGYYHYEISNFAKKGKESKHNMNCWNQEEYVGFGAAAHSYINGIRYSNTENLEEYIENMKIIKKDKISIYQIHERQTRDDQQKEYMLLGLRKLDGVSIAKFKEKFVENPIFLFRKELEMLTKEELLEVDGDRIKLTHRGLDLANQVWEQFV